MMHSLLIWGLSAGAVLVILLVALAIKDFKNRCKHKSGFDYAGDGRMICKRL